MKSATKLISTVILVALVGIVYLAAHRHPFSPGEKAIKVDDPIVLELAPADVATVNLRALSRSLPISGSLMPVVQTTIKAQISGELLDVTVREGQNVKRGEVLARIDERNLGAQRDSAQAALEKARADLALSKLNRDNGVPLLKEHFIAQNAMDSLVSTYDANAALAKAAEANLRLAQLSVDYATVRAPFDGVVSQRLVQPGEKVSSDVSLLTLVDLSQMELDAPAPTAEIPAVRVGQSARFHVDGFSGRDFEGKVWRINPVTDQGSRSITVYLTVPNPGGELRGGMFAQGELTLDKGIESPSIPMSAVRQEAGTTYAWVVANGLVERHDIKVGTQVPDEGVVEVLEGLKTGDQVVTAKIDALKAGTKVRIVASGTPAASAPDAKS